jgi:trk system potassium uptake protein TrkA
MRIVIVGAGKSGTFLAEKLRRNHDVCLIESRRDRSELVSAEMPDIDVVRGDACEPVVLEAAHVADVDAVAAVTGDDEDNLVVSWLAKTLNPDVLTFARINHPKNEWLFTEEWGVDVAVSSAVIIEQLVEHEMTLGDVVDVLRLRAEGVAMEEVVLPADSKAAGSRVQEIRLPEGTHIVAIVSKRNGLQIARPDTLLVAGDELLLLTDHPDAEAIRRALDLPERHSDSAEAAKPEA